MMTPLGLQLLELEQRLVLAVEWRCRLFSPLILHRNYHFFQQHRHSSNDGF